MSKVRALDVNYDVLLPLSDWGAARAAAHALKEDFGAVFTVHRVKGQDSVIVTRIA